MASRKPTSKVQNGSARTKQPPILFERTQALIDKLEKALDGRLLTYWHSSRGDVAHSDVVALFEILERLGSSDRVYLFVKSSGGNGKAALRFVNLLRKHCSTLVVLTPLECASAATMVALGANEIQMGPMAYLTAVDVSLTHDLSPVDRDNDRVGVSLDELRRVVRLWRDQSHGGDRVNPYAHLYQHVHPLVIGAVDRASSLSAMLSRELLSYHMKDNKRIRRIANSLNAKYPSHNYPILLDEAQRLGLKAQPMDRTVNSLLLELNEAYSEMGQKAVTDFDELHSHGNEITTILEAAQILVYYQLDQDWFYRSEERRWITMNNNSGWRKRERLGQRTLGGVLHIA
jgi:hypothetical protein